jgi:hypothetical protein
MALNPIFAIIFSISYAQNFIFDLPDGFVKQPFSPVIAMGQREYLQARRQPHVLEKQKAI